MMSVFEPETVEPSSSLAKGIDKEKELAHHLRLQNPAATVSRTSNTGDGGKDIILKESGETIYYEVKNWARPMSVHDIRRYINLHESSSAEYKVFNEGGFSEAAQQAADAVRLELISGSEYQPPSLQQRLIWIGVRCNLRFKAAFNSGQKTISRIGWRASVAGKRAILRMWCGLVHSAIKTGKWARQRLPIQLLAFLGIIVGTVWLILRWRDDEYSYSDLVKPATLLLISLVLYWLLDD